MKSIGTRLDPHVHHGARLPAIFGLGIFHEVEFLDGVNGQDRRRVGEWTGHVGDRSGIEGVNVDDAVHHPDRFVRARAVGTLRPGSAAGIELNAGAQSQQILVIPAVQRQVSDIGVVERAAHSGVGGFHQRNRFGHGECLRLFAGLECQVHARLLADLEDNVLALHGPETFGLNANGIFSGKEVRSVVLPGVIGGQSSRDSSVHVCNCDRGAGNHAPSLVCNGSENTAITALREKRKADQKHA